MWNAFVLAGSPAAILAYEVNIRVDYLLRKIELKGRSGLSVVIGSQHSSPGFLLLNLFYTRKQ